MQEEASSESPGDDSSASRDADPTTPFEEAKDVKVPDDATIEHAPTPSSTSEEKPSAERQAPGGGGAGVSPPVMPAPAAVSEPVVSAPLVSTLAGAEAVAQPAPGAPPVVMDAPWAAAGAPVIAEPAEVEAPAGTKPAAAAAAGSGAPAAAEAWEFAGPAGEGAKMEEVTTAAAVGAPSVGVSTPKAGFLDDLTKPPPGDEKGNMEVGEVLVDSSRASL